MTNLPKVQEHLQLIQAVNARELHAFLQSRQDFSTWIKNRIADYDFVENQDFIRFHKKMEANNATMIEYVISLDMAKELSMVERNEQGKKARKYFIECEKRLHTNTVPQTYLEALEALVVSEKAKIALEQQAKLDAPKIAHYDMVAERSNLINATQVGTKIKLSAQKLNGYLDELGVYNKSVKRNARTFNLWFIEQGLGRMVQTDRGYDQALFTHRGEAWIIEKLTHEGVLA